MHYILRSKDQSSGSQWNNICWNHHRGVEGIQYLMSRVSSSGPLPFLLPYQQHKSTEGSELFEGHELTESFM